MIGIRRDAEIYEKRGEWFHARWHFSFDEYWDPDNVGFGSMRVFNDDRLVPGAIWPMHPHRDVEGLTYVVEGTFRHQDDVGGPPGMLPAGSVQRMTLGSGAWHSEQNGSETDPLHFIQIWIMPSEPGLPPGVEQRVFTKEDRTDRLLEVVSGSGGGAVLVHQDAAVYVSSLGPGGRVEHTFDAGRGGYLYLIEGAVEINGRSMRTGDAARIAGERRIQMGAEEASELLMVEVRLPEA